MILLISCITSCAFLCWTRVYPLGLAFVFQWYFSVFPFANSWWLALLTKPVIFGVWMGAPLQSVRLMLAFVCLFDARVQTHMEHDRDKDFLVFNGALVKRNGAISRPRLFLRERLIMLTAALLLAAHVWSIPACVFLWLRREEIPEDDVRDFKLRRLRAWSCRC